MKNIHTQNEKYPSFIAGDMLISGILYEHQRMYGYGKVTLIGQNYWVGGGQVNQAFWGFVQYVDGYWQKCA